MCITKVQLGGYSNLVPVRCPTLYIHTGGGTGTQALQIGWFP